MEGAALKSKREYDLAIFEAWHTAIFVLDRYQGKLKPLGKYLASETSQPENYALKNAQGIAFFRRLQAQGLPVKIERVTRH